MRWFLFLVFITLGVAMGLIYGWIINPAQYTDTSPEMLKMDYQSDYVLMVAEAYQVDQDVDRAAQRLAFLAAPDLILRVKEAIAFAQEIGYHPADVTLMNNLLVGLEAGLATGGVP